MKLLALGCGDAFSARWYSSCLAVESDGTWLLIDCPHPIRKILRESGAAAGLALDVADLAGLVLTHLHADHSSGLEGLGFYSAFALGRPIPVLAHPEVVRTAWETRAPTMSSLSLDGRATVGPDRYFDFRHLDESAAVEFGPFRIECRRTLHPVPTFALRIAAGGRRLGHSADTAFDPDLIDWLSGSDLIVHETNLGLHTPYEELAALPAELRSRMRLIHYPDGFDLDASAIEPLRQGRLYEV